MSFYLSTKYTLYVALEDKLWVSTWLFGETEPCYNDIRLVNKVIIVIKQCDNSFDYFA